MKGLRTLAGGFPTLRGRSSRAW